MRRKFLVLYRLACLGFIMSAITIMVCIPWTFKWRLSIYPHLENGIIKNIVLCIVYTSVYWGPILSRAFLNVAKLKNYKWRISSCFSWSGVFFLPPNEWKIKIFMMLFSKFWGMLSRYLKVQGINTIILIVDIMKPKHASRYSTKNFLSLQYKTKNQALRPWF